MPKAKLTDGPAGNVHRKPPSGKTLEIYDTVQPGLSCRIGARGGSYLVVFRIKGQRNQLRRKVGAVKTTSLEDARAKAKAIIKDAEAGISPDDREADATETARVAAEARAKADATTFLSVATQYLDDGIEGAANLRSKAQLERRLKVDLRALHTKPIREIKRADIKQLIKAKAQTSGSSSNRLLSFVKVVFGWAAGEDLIDADPTAGLKKLGKEKPRERFLDEREIRLFWRGCDALGDPAGRLFKLCLVLAQRRGEVAGMRRSELRRISYPVTLHAGTRRERHVDTEFDCWVLPPKRVKRNVEHVVFLSALARELIDDAPRSNGEDFDHILASGRRGDQSVSGWSRYKRALDTAIGKIMAEDAGEVFVPATKDRPASHGLPDWHIHDLRATAISHWKKPPLSVPRAVRSRIANHAEGFEKSKSQTEDYERYTWEAEAADALERWGERIRKLVSDPGGNVVSIADRRGA